MSKLPVAPVAGALWSNPCTRVDDLCTPRLRLSCVCRASASPAMLVGWLLHACVGWFFEFVERRVCFAFVWNRCSFDFHGGGEFVAQVR